MKPKEAQVYHLAVSVLPSCSGQVKSLSQSGFKRRDKSIPSLDGLHKELTDGPKLPSSEKPVHKADPDWYLGTWTWTELCPFTDKMGSLQPSCLYKPCGLYRQLLLSLCWNHSSRPGSVSMQPINKEPGWCSCKQCSGRQPFAHVSMCY